MLKKFKLFFSFKNLIILKLRYLTLLSFTRKRIYTEWNDALISAGIDLTEPEIIKKGLPYLFNGWNLVIFQ